MAVKEFGTWADSAKLFVPLAMKKWEIDQQNQKWQEQLVEAKRAHNLNLGSKLLEMGNVEAAVPFLQKGGMEGVPAESITASPVAQLNKAKTTSAIEELRAKQDLRERLKGVSTEDYNVDEAAMAKLREAGINPEGNLESEPAQALLEKLQGEGGVTTSPRDTMALLNDALAAGMEAGAPESFTGKLISEGSKLQSATERAEEANKMRLQIAQIVSGDRQNAANLRYLASKEGRNRPTSQQKNVDALMDAYGITEAQAWDLVLTGKKTDRTTMKGRLVADAMRDNPNIAQDKLEAQIEKALDIVYGPGGNKPVSGGGGKKDSFGYTAGQTVSKNGKTYKYIGNNKWQVQ